MVAIAKVFFPKDYEICNPSVEIWRLFLPPRLRICRSDGISLEIQNSANLPSSTIFPDRRPIAMSRAAMTVEQRAVANASPPAVTSGDQQLELTDWRRQA
ncbi:hypothetical protein ACLOJK_006837 [Asimina triloba]